MAQVKSFASKVLWFVLRGAVLGASLGAVFPEEAVRAHCDCHDYGGGSYSCSSGNASSCSPGIQTCDVTCTEAELE